MMPQLMQRNAAVIPGGGEIGFKCQRRVISRERLRITPELLQRIGASG